MDAPAPARRPFAYDARSSADGSAVSGTIDAVGIDDARRHLRGMNLDVSRIGPADDGDGTNGEGTNGDGTKGHAKHNDAPAPRRVRRLAADDLAAFNEQLAHLASAGLPLEGGLRLVAEDLRGGPSRRWFGRTSSDRLADASADLADDLERGTPVAEAFDRHRGRFPALYGRLVEAGIAGGDLPGVLLNLGRHLRLVRRLRSAVWRAVSYPLAVLAGLLAVLVFLSVFVLPQMEVAYADFFVQQARMYGNIGRFSRRTPPDFSALPWPTRVLLATGRALPWVALGLVIVAAGAWVSRAVLRRSGAWSRVTDAVGVRLPLVGPVLATGAVARWLDAARLGVSAGLDLPAAVGLAGEAAGSPALRADGDRLVEKLREGRPLRDATPDLRRLPATVPAAIDLASETVDLASVLGSLADLYERQAEARLDRVPLLLTPLLLALIAAVIGLVLAGLVLPLVRMLNGMTSFSGGGGGPSLF